MDTAKKLIGEDATKNILDEFPFRCVLSFEPLIDLIRSTISEDKGSISSTRSVLEEILTKAPQLQEPIKDHALLRPLGPWIERLMSLVFPSVYWDAQPLAAVVPFTIKPVFVSPEFQRLFLNDDGSFSGRRNVKEEDFNRGRAMRAYFLVLEKRYNIRHSFDYPLVHIVRDKESGLERHYKMNLDFRFVEVRHVRGDDTVLNSDMLGEITDNLTEPEKLRAVLPPEDFEIRGLTLLHAVDVTQTEVLAGLERDLVDQDTIVSQEGFLRLQDRLRTLFQRKDLTASIAALQDDQVFLLSSGVEIQKSCIFQNSRHIPMYQFEGTAYQKAVTSGKILRIPDLLREDWPEHLKEDILARGVRSLIIVPLFYKGQCIGNLDFATNEPGALGPMDVLFAEQLQPLFAVAVQHSLDDFHNRIDGLIKQECTAIHPTVEWRFRKAAMNYLEKTRTGNAAELEPIVFKDVFPLYATSDIRGSATARNSAIQKDLNRHLELALNVFKKAHSEKPLMVFMEITTRIEKTRERLQNGLGSGDEVSVLGFLKTEVEPFFEQAAAMTPRVKGAVEAYFDEVDAKLGTVYRLRQAFEESVSMLNDRLVSYLDLEEEKAQTLFPHYFERHRTDGVDYVIYVGKSLSENSDFNELYLRDIRLWQLKVACGMAWHTQDLKSSLKVPLDTAHLILIQNTPLSIRFRYDEKRFDVDGSYDVRHEILKSRIDKARVKETSERLTQPGKIAIVYSHPEEAREMRRHIEFIRDAGFLKGDMERLDLGDLPGVQGLKAFRVDVDLESPVLAEVSTKV